MSTFVGLFSVVALTLAAIAMRLRTAESCPVCRGPTRLHESFFMCDRCQSVVGLRLNGKAYISQ